MSIVIFIIETMVQVITVVVIADIIISYFMSPYHPVRLFLDRLVQPMLRPIQRVLPSFGGLDFSPFILLLALQLVGSVLVSLVRMLS